MGPPLTDLWVPRSATATTEGADELSGHFARWQMELLQERIGELEDHLWRDEQGWSELGQSGDIEWSKHALDTVVRRCRLFWLSNPLIRRGVNLRTYYTWGQGVDVSAGTEGDRRAKDVVDALMADDDNAAELFSPEARLDADVALQTDGNLFAALFTDSATGAVQVRTVPPEQITDIVRDPEDRRRVWYYRRDWTAQTFDVTTGRQQVEQRTVWYPSVDYWPQTRPATIGGHEVKWDAPMVHLREGGLRDQRFATPVVYPALDWARAHKRFIEDWYTIVRSLSRFAWKWSGPGRKASAAQAKLATGVTSSDASEDNPLPPAGSVAIAPEGQDLTPMPKTGATVDVEDAKQARLMIASALEVPDTWLSGDVDVGNHATARTLDRPTELMIASRRDRWEGFVRRIVRYALDQAAIAPSGPLTGRVVVDRERERRTVEHRSDVTVAFDWPPLQEQGTKEQIDAVVNAATLAGNADADTIPREALQRKLLSTLGFDNVDELVSQAARQAPAAEGALAEAADRLAACLEEQP